MSFFQSTLLFSDEHGELGWDDPTPGESHRAWETLISEFLSFPEITVSRSVRPVAGIGFPELFAFFDGSLDAYASCIYVRWLVGDQTQETPEYQVRLLVGKASHPSEGIYGS